VQYRSTAVPAPARGRAIQRRRGRPERADRLRFHDARAPWLRDLGQRWPAASVSLVRRVP